MILGARARNHPKRRRQAARSRVDSRPGGQTMRKTVLSFGLVSGGVAVVLMLAVIPFLQAKEFLKSDLVGYSSMLASALLVFFGIRSYRERVGGGRISFGRGFVVGVLISAVAGACAVVGFEIIYFKLVPGFGDTFSACMVERA